MYPRKQRETRARPEIRYMARSGEPHVHHDALHTFHIREGGIVLSMATLDAAGGISGVPDTELSLQMALTAYE